MTIEEIMATLYSEIASKQREKERYDYDDQTRRAYREELRVIEAEVSAYKKVIKLLQKMEEDEI